MSSTLPLPERLTIAEARATLEHLLGAIGQADAAPVIDAAPLKALDTSAVAVLLECRRHAQQLGKSLSLRDTPAKLEALARLYGVDGLLGLQASTSSSGSA